MKNKKRILCFIILLSILFVLAGCGSQEGQENGNSLATVTIIGPDDVGVILEETEVEIQKDDTALDVLEKAVQEKNIQLEYSGSGTTAYVKAINGLSELDRGAESGWLYRVNGEIPDEGAGTYIVQNGDHLEWFYTTNLSAEFD